MASAKKANAHGRAHSLLLLTRLLNLRDGASPLTLVLDDLEQTAGPVLAEFFIRAKAPNTTPILLFHPKTKTSANGYHQVTKTKLILASFTTASKPRHVDVMVKAAGRGLDDVKRQLTAHYPTQDPKQPPGTKLTHRAIVVIDSLNSLASTESVSLARFLSSLATAAVSIVAVYHTDVPVVLPRTCSEYQPTPLAIFSHLATAILKPSSLRQQIARQAARNRALQEPEWGLREGREGAIIGVRNGSSDADDDDGIVINMELRRRSGRAVLEKFILTPAASGPGRVSLLTDHPSFAPAAPDEGDKETPESTFDLGLTEKQRKDRAGVVLPYFDAQTDIGSGEGGRILYDMGREDDFDDEEDEI
ncbi:hypothetical protein L249_5705 [Ophiocordyceps polyrhachis-furcata BCC 54312]|uniref:Elongator complex protein 5 n=1 Tax=Ophiocordyceps polyrhachis-furcata BCC 54312 TaxID=1330021 RepID=A0A367L022_9HYPO|nr:hypothetical protein L249_5705 [Ophiocordyceps polyrhachis-furcata BCC 54312]